MALIVESGAIVAGAESYISVTDADTYHSNLGNTSWAALTTTAKEQALRKATNYMTGRYTDKWRGYRKSSSQALDWPRSWVPIQNLVSTEYVLDTVVPTEVKNACASLALRASSADLLADETRAKVRTKVDVIETEYDRFSPQRKRYPEIDAMLSPYLKSAGGALEVVRV